MRLPWPGLLADAGPLPIVFFVLVFVLVLAAVVYAYWCEQKRVQGIRDWARAEGLVFNPAKDWSFEDHYPEFPCLREGSNRYAYNLITGNRGGYELCGFDYHYETYSRDKDGKRRTHHHYFSGLIVHTDLALKPLLIRPENFLDKFTEFLGFDDIDFEWDAFSRKFFVKSPDKRWAYDVLHQATMEFLMQQPAFTLQLAGHRAIAYRSRCFGANDFQAACDTVQGVLDRLPIYLVRELKGID